MKNIAIYPGSFNPWHEGHRDIYIKATDCFDRVIIAVGFNPDKDVYDIEPRLKRIQESSVVKMDMSTGKTDVVSFSGLLVDFVKEVENQIKPDCKVAAIVRGLRNGHDLQYEMNQQYWNEDLGLRTPIAHFICDRTKSHISSSMIRALERIQK